MKIRSVHLDCNTALGLQAQMLYLKYQVCLAFNNMIDIKQQVTCARAAPAPKILAFLKECQDHFRPHTIKRQESLSSAVSPGLSHCDLVKSACRAAPSFSQDWRRETQVRGDKRPLDHLLPTTPLLSVDRWSGEELEPCTVSGTSGKGGQCPPASVPLELCESVFPQGNPIHLGGKRPLLFYLWNQEFSLQSN